MTLNTSPTRVDYVENGETVVHFVPFEFAVPGELVVSRISGGVETTLMPDVDYTVQGGDGGPGLIVKADPGVAGTVISIKRQTVTLVTPKTFLDTRLNTDLGSHVQTSALARFVFETEATEIIVTSWNDIYQYYPNLAELGLWVDGVYQTIHIPGIGQRVARIVLPASGVKKCEIVNGAQTNMDAAIRGTFLVSVEGDQPIIPTSEAPTGGGVLFYGDSITVGDRALFPTGMGLAMLVRAAAEDVNVGVEAYGVRALQDDANGAPAQAAFVAQVVQWTPSILWMMIGTNDYGVSRQSAANFGAQYAAVLDQLHAALPDLKIYAQTPLLRSSEVANAFGNTLGDYRAQIAAVVATRTSFATLIDGTTILATTSLVDGIHPNTAGHATIGAFISATLGFSAGAVGAVPEIAATSSAITVTQPVPGTYRILKNGGGAGFNAGARGVNVLKGDFTIQAMMPSPVALIDVLFGVSSEPNADNGISIAHAVYFSGGGAVQAFEAGIDTLEQASTNYVTPRPAWIRRRDGIITYRFGTDETKTVDTAEIFRTVKDTSEFYFDCTLFGVGQYIDVQILP